MKKLLVVVMSIIMVLSLCACGGKGAGGNGGLLSSEPTEQENGVISTYVNILNALESYLEDGEISIYDVENEIDVEGSKALEYCYKTIQELESVDKWIGTEYISDTRTRQELLDSFTVVKDVKLQDKTVDLDHLGNVKKEYGGFYQYNANGEIVEGCMSHVDGYFILGEYDKIGLNFMVHSCLREYTCFYGETGKIEYMQDTSDRITPSYDSAGRIISVEQLTSDGYKQTYSLSYDNENRVSRMEQNRVKDEGYVEIYHFIYDDNNKLIREEHDRKCFDIYGTREISDSYTDYVYDANGKLTSAVETTSEGWENRLTVSYAEDGRHVTYDIEDLDSEGNVDRILKQERIYGDFYIYNPNK